MKKKIGVILMTYGSPGTLDFATVHQYLKNVYGGREPEKADVAEFLRRYKLVGGSPLVKITQNQAAALQKELNAQKLMNYEFHAVAGMRFSDPFLTDVVKEELSDMDEIVGIIMSPQYSPIIMKGYIRELTEAVESLGRHDIKLRIAQDWHLQSYFLQAMAEKVKKAIDDLPEDVQKTVPVLFSAHSMPKRVIDKEPDYIDELKETAAEIAKLVGLPADRWMFCYQSAGHTPEEWLKPDFADVMPELEKAGQTHVIIAPVQFLADHLEILYDVGIGAREQAEEHGISFARTESLNTSPLFIKALAEVTKQQIGHS